jgi:ABC-2 type transport system ATP-binding protein
MMRRGAAIAVLAIAVAVLPASAAHARDAIVDSFDGEPIVTHFFPAKGLGAGQRAPTILMGRAGACRRTRIPTPG